MRTFYLFQILLWLTIITFSNSTHAQLYEISFDQRLDQSSLIIEGKVIEIKSYRGNNGKIYTANKIQVFSVLKGNLQNPKITIITLGGTVGSKRETWTNVLTLSEYQIGVFFLTTTHRPLSDEIDNLNNVYEVYSSSQGFLRYSEDKNKVMVAKAPFNNYQKNRLIQNIREKTNQFISISSNETGNPEDLTGVEYSIQNVSLSGNVVDFDIYVEGLWGSYDLTRSELIVEYDPTVLGSNISSNGIIAVTKGTVSNSPNYNLAVGDINPNELSIKIEALNTGLGLYTITNLQEQLIHIQITSPNAGNPDIEFDEANMQQLSEFLDANNLPEVFQQVFAVGSINDIGGGSSSSANITSFSPNIVAAGIGDTLTITGSGFGLGQGGVLPPVGSSVLFTKTEQNGATAHDWMLPMPGDYISWTDAEIKVRVPSIGYEDDDLNVLTTPTTPAFIHAGTGIIGVKTGGNSGTIDTSTTQLYVRFSAHTDAYLGTNGATATSRKLVSRNGVSGYDLYFTPSFKAFNGGQGVEAFKRALSTWRCATGVNFRIKELANIPSTYQANACKIDYGSMPIGVPATQIAYTYLPDVAPFCASSPTNVWYSYLEKFDLIFSDTAILNWHTTVDTPVINWTNTIDFETVAVHELGHTHLLTRTNNLPNLMHWLGNEYHRTIPNDDLLGGLYIVQISAVDTIPACQPAMQKIPSSECDITTGLWSIIKDDISVTFYPNPTTSIINVEINSNDVKGQLKYQISNNIGQLLSYGQLINGTNINSINIHDLPNGMLYFTIYIDGVRSNTFKIIKI
jgi:hypothetical protein